MASKRLVPYHSKNAGGADDNTHHPLSTHITPLP